MCALHENVTYTQHKGIHNTQIFYFHLVTFSPYTGKVLWKEPSRERKKDPFRGRFLIKTEIFKLQNNQESSEYSPGLRILSILLFSIMNEILQKRKCRR